MGETSDVTAGRAFFRRFSAGIHEHSSRADRISFFEGTMGKRRDESKAHHVILSIEVTGGFLKGLNLAFADGLNALIGGRGAGKTTVLELIRFALGQIPDPKIPPARAKALSTLIEHNLEDGSVRLRVKTKDG